MLLLFKPFLLSCAFIIFSTDALVSGPSPLNSVTGSLSGAANPLGSATGSLGAATSSVGNPLGSATGVLGTATGALNSGGSPLSSVTGLTSNLPVVGGLTGGGAPAPGAAPASGAAPAPGAPPTAPVPPIAPAPPPPANVPPAAVPTNDELAMFSQAFATFSALLGDLLSKMASIAASRNPSQITSDQGQTLGQLPPISGDVRSDSEEDILVLELKKLKEDMKLLSNSQNKQCLYFGMCIAKDIIRELIYGAKRRGSDFISIVHEILGTFLNRYENNEIMSSSPDTNCVLNYQNSCPLVQNIRWYNPSL